MRRKQKKDTGIVSLPVTLLAKCDKYTAVTAEEEPFYRHHRLINDLLSFPKHLTAVQVLETIENAFEQQLNGIYVCQLLKPTKSGLHGIVSTTEATAANLPKLFRQKVIYAQPLRDLNLPPSPYDEIVNPVPQRRGQRQPRRPSYLNDFEETNSNYDPLDSPPDSPALNGNSRPLNSDPLNLHQEQMTDEVVSLEEALTNIQKNIDRTNEFRIFIDRRNPWQNLCMYLKGKPEELNKKLSVTIINEAEEEPAVDRGGPTHDVLAMALQDALKSEIFFGIGKKNLSHNFRSAKENEYYCLGALLALCIAYGIPIPSVFTETFVRMILYGNAKPVIQDVQFSEVNNTLFELENSEDLERINDIIISNEYLHIAGGRVYLSTLEEKREMLEGKIPAVRMPLRCLPAFLRY